MTYQKLPPFTFDISTPLNRGKNIYNSQGVYLIINIGDLTSLMDLDLNSNQFVGLPDSLTNMKLNIIDLSDNVGLSVVSNMVRVMVLK